MKGRHMTIQPIILTYNMEKLGPGQPIPVLDRKVGGDGLEIDFNFDKKDPGGHHNNAGGDSVMNGPGNPPRSADDRAGYIVWGGVHLWIVDLWAPDPYTRTEFQMWVNLHKVVGGLAQSAVFEKTLAIEAYAPLQHDDDAWLPSGMPRIDYDDPDDPEGHDESVKHHGYPVFPMWVPGDCRGRVAVGQMHGNKKVPAPVDKPYPGYIRRATCNLMAMAL